MSAHQKSANKPSGSQQIYIGPAGWSYPDWKRILYPEPRPKGFHEATFLAEFFNTIEINTSFYHPMQPAHAEQWIERVAGNPKFLFTAKLWRNFTHDDSTTAATWPWSAPASTFCKTPGALALCCCSSHFRFTTRPKP